MVTGRCQCAAIAWRLDGEITFISHCHCSICRRIHGAAFGTFAHGDASAFHWVRGEGSIARYESSPGVFRAFCRACGSQVPVIERDQMCIPAGGIDGDPGAPLEMGVDGHAGSGEPPQHRPPRGVGQGVKNPVQGMLGIVNHMVYYIVRRIIVNHLV